MFDHLGIYVSNLQESREFYRQVLAGLGVRLLEDHVQADGTGWLVFGSGAPRSPFFVVALGRPPHWRAEHEIGKSPVHIAFCAASPAAVDAFHATGLRLGATNNGAAGVRRPAYYCAFLIDADGNNIEAGAYS